MEEVPRQRTNQQSRALHLFCKRLADSLNDAGLDQRVVLKESILIPWTKESVKEQLWHPIQKALYGTDSTVFLHKVDQIEHIHEIIMRELGKKFGVEYISFPSDGDDIAPLKNKKYD